MNAHQTEETPAYRRKGRLSGLVRSFGGRFSSSLGIDLHSRDSREIFKWLLAAILFGARISETLAVRTYREFAAARLDRPDKLIRRGWEGLVGLLDRGGYVRYDFKTATKLLEVSRTLVRDYGGDLNTLHATAAGGADLERRIRALAKGVGEVTANIFLREMRGIWPKAESLPSEITMLAAKDLGIIPNSMTDRSAALRGLCKAWADEGNRERDFPEFESALLRAGLRLRRKASAARLRAAVVKRMH